MTNRKSSVFAIYTLTNYESSHFAKSTNYESSYFEFISSFLTPKPKPYTKSFPDISYSSYVTICHLQLHLFREYFISSEIITCDLCKYILIYILPNPNYPNCYQIYMYFHYFSDCVFNYLPFSTSSLQRVFHLFRDYYL